MPYKVITLLLALIALFLHYSAPRHNLAYQAPSQVSPSMYSDSCKTSITSTTTDGFFISTISTATDGFMTQYSG